jgi:hypothetical protein
VQDLTEKVCESFGKVDTIYTGIGQVCDKISDVDSNLDDLCEKIDTNDGKICQKLVDLGGDLADHD